MTIFFMFCMTFLNILFQTNRVYRLHLPTAYASSNDAPTPMVVDFHGWSGDSNSQERKSQFAMVSNEDPDGFIVLTAEGMSDMNHRKFICFEK